MRSARSGGLCRNASELSLTGVVMLAAVAGGACTGTRARSAPATADHACTLVPRPAAPATSATVLLTWPLDPINVARPSNPGEQFVFEQAYETLVRVDCVGRLAPGLAASWTRLPAGGWRLVLREGARFGNGDPVTAGDVIASWRATGRASTAALARRMAEGSRIVDDRTLDMATTDSLPVALGDPELVVVRRSAASWPDGTAGYRVSEVSGQPPGVGRGQRTLVLDAPATANVPRLTIHSRVASDARDLIDAGADLVLTDDPALVAYATRADMVALELDWARTFTLLTPSRGSLVADSAVGLDMVVERTHAFRAALASDAVRADARPAPIPGWWRATSRCAPGAPPARTLPNEPTSPRIAYARDAPVARALAERLAAVAATGRSGAGDTSLALLAPSLLQAAGRVTTVSLAPDALAAALGSGSELAFVVAVPARSFVPCVDLERLFAAAPWLAADSGRGELPRTIIPLIETRADGVVRRDRLGLSRTWGGSVAVASSTPSAGGVPQ